MQSAKPKNEESRVAALEKYAILDTDPEVVVRRSDAAGVVRVQDSDRVDFADR